MTYDADKIPLTFGDEENTYGTKPATTDTWIGIVPQSTFPTRTNNIKKWWAAGEGRDLYLMADGEATLDGTLPFVLQNGYIWFFVMGKVVDTGTDVGGGGGSTLNGDVAAWSNSVVVVSSTGYVTNDYIQIGTTNAEIRKITNVNVNTLTLDKKLRRAHASGETCNEVTSPYTHVMEYDNTICGLGSFTLETKYGDCSATPFVRWATGCKVNSASLEAAEAGELMASIDVIGKKDSKATSTTTVQTGKTDLGYMWHQAAWTIGGSSIIKITNFRASINHNLRPKRYMQSTDGQYVYEIREGHRTHELTFNIVIDDATWWDRLLDGTTFDAYVVFTRGASDTFRIDWTTCKVGTAPHNIPDEGEVNVGVSVVPRRTKYTFVDSNPYY